MSESDLIAACVKNDKTAKKQLFEMYYKKLAFISSRYCKNASQAEDVLMNGYTHIFYLLHTYKNNSKLSVDEFITHHFIAYIISYIKSIRNEYYVASTVKAVEHIDNSYDLFLDNYLIDFRTINQPILLKSIQELVPSQRLIFNLHVIDGYDLSKASELLETNEQTLKSNLEKARFNLQKVIEKNLKLNQYEQSV